VIVSSIDAHFVRNARRIFGAVGAGRRTYMLDRYFADELVREVNTYAAVDGVLAVSEKETSLINDLTGSRDHAWWVPVTQEDERGPLPFEDRKGALFVGNFRHGPNVEAVEYLCAEIVPLIDAELLERHPI